MARYTIHVQACGRSASILIVLSSSSLVAALRDKIIDRLSDLHLGISSSSHGDIVLHLSAADGPRLDVEDLLSDAVEDPRNEAIYAVIGGEAEANEQELPFRMRQHPAESPLRIRVITPELACLHTDIEGVPVLPNSSLTSSSTLADLRAHVQQHLGLTAQENASEDLDCNCALGRKIDEFAVLNGPNELDALTSVVVVYGKNCIIRIPVREATRAAVENAVNEYAHANFPGRDFRLIGGTEDTSGSHTRYIKLPVVVFCSPGRHGLVQRVSQQSPAQSNSPILSALRSEILDLHTSEMSIEFTAHNANLTLAEAGLDDCTINGVLNLYALKRSKAQDAERNDIPLGKDKIFCHNEAWEPQSGQTQRGLANFLSTLRVFASLTSVMEPSDQDAILHVFHLLTRFPPAVRAMYTLVLGKSLSRSDQAAIAQCVYEVLKTTVPLQIGDSDSTRLFENTRLLFGLILEKAKHVKASVDDMSDSLPYMDTCAVKDLRNSLTMEPVAQPVQTISGLVDQGVYDAFKDDGGFLRWTNDFGMAKVGYLDRELDRAVRLSGGTRPQIVTFDIDAINASRRYENHTTVDSLISPTEISDPGNLSTLCDRNQLGVVHPSSLRSTRPPALTLDRLGLLAVYLGRQGCAAPGEDVILFRPTSRLQVEETVDVSIVTQQLVPILEQRDADRTARYEEFGARNRQLRDPDEVAIMVLDCSISMSSPCGFVDIQEEEDEFELNSDADYPAGDSHTNASNDGAFQMDEIDEIKTFLSTHESFADMLAIVRTGTEDFHRLNNAQKVLNLLRIFIRQEIQEEESKAQGRTRANQNLTTLKVRSRQLHKYRELLKAYLLHCSENISDFDAPLVWTVEDGNNIPNVPKSTIARHEFPEFEIPDEYLCPISKELMVDPVYTVDGFVYERRNVERWFTTHVTSPCTNLPLADLDLRPKVPVKAGITDWVAGSDILSRYHWPPSQISISLKSDTGEWPLKLPIDITLSDVYEIAFRRSRGRYPKFSLSYRNTLLLPSQDLARFNISADDVIFITPFEQTVDQNADGQTEELCLVKVYEYYQDNALSYWEPRTSTRTLGSAVFRFYRQKFLQNAFTQIRESFVMWTDLEDTGNGRHVGYLHHHWEPLTNFLTPEHCKGHLAGEPVFSPGESDPEIRANSHQMRPLVFKFLLGVAPKTKESRSLSRMDVLKAMFDAYLNRLLAYNFQTHLGLISFSSKADLIQPITHAIENFRHQLNNINARGNTACWDAIALARDRLIEYGEQYPNAKLRIICLSDGEDNVSRSPVFEVSQKLQNGNILLDSICLGKASNTDLKTVAYLTGGYIFEPTTMERAMAICEMEPVLSQLERPDIVLPKEARIPNALTRFQQAKKASAVVKKTTGDVIPERRECPGLSSSFVELGTFTRNPSIARRSDSNVRLTRILSEIQNAGANPHPYYDVYICESNMALWKVVMQGPPGSSYETGTFLLYLEMGEDYPRFAPNGRFITPVHHPNINAHGKICHSIFDRNWTTDMTNKNVLDTVYSLLLVPEFSDPINAVVTLNYHWDEVQFKEEVVKHIQKHATKTRAEWRSEIIG